jgi:hypothetical protein
MPQDGKDDDEQLERLLEALSDPAATAPQRRGGGHKPNGTPSNGNGQPMPPPPPPGPGYRVKNVEVFYMPETGEVFLDYEWVMPSESKLTRQVVRV